MNCPKYQEEMHNYVFYPHRWEFQCQNGNCSVDRVIVYPNQGMILS